MKRHRDSAGGPSISGLTDLAPRPGTCSPSSGTGARGGTARRRLSSLTPVVVSTGTLLLGSLLGLAAARNVIAQPALATLLFLVAGAHLLVGLALKIRVKSVHFDGHRYRIRGFLFTEEVAPDEVCLVVEARGALWNTLRLHFNRPTRFGYDIAFVPAVSRRDLPVLVAALRAGRDSAPARTSRGDEV